MSSLSFKRQHDNRVTDSDSTSAPVDQILAEEHLTVLHPIGRQGVEGFSAPLTGLLVGGGDHTPCTWLGETEIHLADPNVAPPVLGMGTAAGDDDIRSKTVHRQGERKTAVEPIQRRFRQQQKGIGVGKGETITRLGGRSTQGARVVVGQTHEPC